MGSGASKDDWSQNTRIERFQADLARHDSDGDLFRPKRVLRSGSFGRLGSPSGNGVAAAAAAGGGGGGNVDSNVQSPFEADASYTTPSFGGRSASMLAKLERDCSPAALAAFSPARALKRTPPPTPKTAKKRFFEAAAESASSRHLVQGTTREAIMQQREEERRKREKEHRARLLEMRQEYFLQKLKALQSTQDEILDYRGQRYDESDITYAKKSTLAEVLQRRAQEKREKEVEDHALLEEYRRQYMLDRKRVLKFIQAENFVPNVLVYEWTNRPKRKQEQRRVNSANKKKRAQARKQKRRKQLARKKNVGGKQQNRGKTAKSRNDRVNGTGTGTTAQQSSRKAVERRGKAMRQKINNFQKAGAAKKASSLTRTGRGRTTNRQGSGGSRGRGRGSGRGRGRVNSMVRASANLAAAKSASKFTSRLEAEGHVSPKKQLGRVSAGRGRGRVGSTQSSPLRQHLRDRGSPQRLGQLTKAVQQGGGNVRTRPAQLRLQSQLPSAMSSSSRSPGNASSPGQALFNDALKAHDRSSSRESSSRDSASKSELLSPQIPGKDARQLRRNDARVYHAQGEDVEDGSDDDDESSGSYALHDDDDDDDMHDDDDDVDENEDEGDDLGDDDDNDYENLDDEDNDDDDDEDEDVSSDTPSLEDLQNLWFEVSCLLRASLRTDADAATAERDVCDCLRFLTVS
eukprot:INCI9157.2.p1 GENE.INCI9157.2~~INCI9157.2.p1  ORF type:complete len:689 (+),score=170.52 INCI9157.2:123-2189(+)